jgi:putative DNA-invertase from lambdoid prophage Rac
MHDSVDCVSGAAATNQHREQESFLHFQSPEDGRITPVNRAALYLRVSTEEQTVENQRPELEAMARARGFQVLEVYEEQESAAKRRPVLERLMDDARRARFDVLLVWALDRLGRSTIGNLLLVHELEQRGVHLVAARDSWLETSGPARTPLVALLSWVAEQERVRIGERTRAGMARARAAGVHIGRRHRLSPSEVERADKMRRAGRSVRSIAKALRCPKSTVARALSQKGCP